jgi:uncharacterized protein with HEPN domain
MCEGRKRAWRFYVSDMLDFAKKVRSYTKGMDQPAFETNDLIYDATLRNLELIGEAATHVPDEVRAAHPEVPWRMIVATRNRLIHGYLGIDDDTVWSILTDDLPALIPLLESVLEQYLDEAD